MDTFHAFILALVQGFTEFLPISSSAHLILVPELLGWPDQGIAFDVAVHVGTLIAVVVFLRKELQLIIPSWIGGWQNFKWDQHGQLGWLIVLATIPVGLIGLIGEDWIEASLRSPLVIAASTAVFALLLWWSDHGAEANTRTLQNLSWKSALIVGGAQAFALIPGTSRSGVTMTALLAMGYDRISSAKFSFLLAVPTIALPGLLKSKDLIEAGDSIDWMPILLGVFVSAMVALLCMRWFIAAIERVGMLPFVIYRLLLAVFLLWVFF